MDFYQSFCIFLGIILFFSLSSNVFTWLQLRKAWADNVDCVKAKLSLIDQNRNLLLENGKILIENNRLQSQPEPKKVLSIEAQQLLHDMTAHGHALVKITAISPNDVFWRSPQ
jgi:hypothetical protein